ncbi:hypothetical protein ACFE04_011237 [Oxalis oulophora]
MSIFGTILRQYCENVWIGFGANIRDITISWKGKFSSPKDLHSGADNVSLIRDKRLIGLFPGADLRLWWSANYVLPEMSGNVEVAENGLREAGIDYTFSKVLGEDGGDAHEMEDEIYTLAGALEKIVKASQLEIIGLRHSVEQLRVAINNGEAEVAYEPTVNISAHVLKGFLYNKGGDEKTLFPKVPLESGKSRTSKDWTSPIVNPRDTFAASNDRR